MIKIVSVYSLKKKPVIFSFYLSFLSYYFNNKKKIIAFQKECDVIVVSFLLLLKYLLNLHLSWFKEIAYLKQYRYRSNDHV